MAKTSPFEKMDKQHQKLLEKIDELDRMVAEALKEWGAAEETDRADSAADTGLIKAKTD